MRVSIRIVTGRCCHVGCRILVADYRYSCFRDSVYYGTEPSGHTRHGPLTGTGVDGALFEQAPLLKENLCCFSNHSLAYSRRLL